MTARGAGGDRLALGIVDPHIIGERVLVLHALLEPDDGQLLDLVEPVRPPVAAGAGFSRARADYPHPAEVPVFDRHAAAAYPAAQKSGQEMLRAPVLVRLLAHHAAPAYLRGRKGFLVDNAQMWRRLADPFALRIVAAETLARFRVLDHADSVPDQLTAIGRVQDDAVCSLTAPHDGPRHPEFAERRRDVLAVQLARDRAHRSAAGIGGKYSPHYGRLMLEYLAFAWLAGDRPISISKTAAGAAITHDASHAAADLVRQILQKERADQTADADLDLIGLAVMDGTYFDVSK